MSDETIEKTFQVTDPAHLSISNLRGSITIQPGETNVIVVRAVKHGNFDSGRYSIDMTQDSDGTVRVETHGEVMFGFLSHPPKVDFTVRVPPEINLSASVVSSSLKASGLKGEFRLKTVSGNIELDEVSGPIKLNAVSGEISGSRLAGPLEVKEVSGRVRLNESNFTSADVTTVSGSLLLQTPLSDGPYRFSSVSGDVRLFVPADTRCNAELKSVSGSLKSSLPGTTTLVGHGSKGIKIQGGGAEVFLKSVSGGLSIELEGVPAEVISVSSPLPTPPVPPVPPTSSVQAAPEPLSTAEILERIESGEMTVDEAIELMKGRS